MPVVYAVLGALIVCVNGDAVCDGLFGGHVGLFAGCDVSDKRADTQR